jgi:hypothetical protein
MFCEQAANEKLMHLVGQITRLLEAKEQRYGTAGTYMSCPAETAYLNVESLCKGQLVAQSGLTKLRRLWGFPDLTSALPTIDEPFISS